MLFNGCLLRRLRICLIDLIRSAHHRHGRCKARSRALPAGFPCGQTFLLPGPTGALEAMAACPAEDEAVPATAVICHPHPQQGGTMHNKVVHTLARTFSELGLRTVRFNFRGVGASAGHFDHGNGETEDLLAVVSWVRAQRPQDQIWLAGFSFGGYIAARGAQQTEGGAACDRGASGGSSITSVNCIIRARRGS